MTILQVGQSCRFAASSEPTSEAELVAGEMTLRSFHSQGGGAIDR